ncbi:thioredoxin [Mycoplasmopsis phocirhinis]|uniref:Thioredoxin n=1 Tax=Mycoplasmopsis phocirhinis TaxID=142650 RepID=A0A4P6MRN1_9BACT|nr:thioredoxin family protein [Mycoplasmopsis phocirhinis]QBF34719.1 thioredoxin [Mycoplasmopsis phocirhinis]
MKTYSWEEAQKIIANKQNAEKIFFVIFSRQNDKDSIIMSSTYEYIEQKFTSQTDVKFMNIDIDEAKIYKDINNIYKIFDIPTFLIIVNNQIKKRGSKFYPHEIITDFIEENI